MMATPQKAPIRVTQDPEIVTWPETHYVFVEKVGPFQNTAPQAWQEVHPLVARISEQNKVTGYMSLYKIGPKIYRAGVAVAAEPKNLPESMRHEKFKGGKYSRFVLTGSYANLPEASGRVFEIVLFRLRSRCHVSAPAPVFQAGTALGLERSHKVPYESLIRITFRAA